MDYCELLSPPYYFWLIPWPLLDYDVPEFVHMEDSRAQIIGIPGAYDYGYQRISWLDNVVTNWMGNDGFLKNLNGTLKRFNIVGDTHWMKGKVVKKYIVDSEHLVDT